MSNQNKESNCILTNISLDIECTVQCHSQMHAMQILAAVTKGDNSEIQAYSRWLCYNFFNVTDKLGRNILHMAAACGKWKLVDWLLEYCHADINVKDGESGWTALHRSLFYGQIASAKKLLMHNASLVITDHEGLTPLDIIMKDRLPYIEYSIYDPAEAYVWGSNANFNLGLGKDQDRSQPELIEMFRKKNINIKQVVMCEFHSVFLSNEGQVFTCGHGRGGRLGQNSEQAVLVPTAVKGINSGICTEIAAGQDHLVILVEGGQVWTCGLNTYHQLGHVPPPERVLVPRPISQKFIKSQQFTGVCAASYHTVLYTNKAIFTFGLNAGQLGHPKGDRTQVTPRQVSSLDHEDNIITHVVASDGATVCATKKGDIYVLHEYQSRKIASRQLEIQKLSVVGGHLDANCQVASMKEGDISELRIIVLTKSGKIYIWREPYPQLRRCLFNVRRHLIITDVQITQNNIMLTTKDGEGFTGNIVPPKDNQKSVSALQQTSNKKKPLIVPSLTTLLDREECDLLRLKRLHGIYRAIQITSDMKGRNCAVLQSHPKIGLTELPSLPPSNIEENFSQLVQSSHQADDIHDVILHINNRCFIGHKFILASRSEYFKKYFLAGTGTKTTPWNVTIENITENVFEQILQYIYSNSCDFLKEGKEIKWNGIDNASEKLNFDNLMIETEHGVSAYSIALEKSKITKQTKRNKGTANPLSQARDISKRWGITTLSERLNSVKLIGGKIKVGDLPPPPKLKFDRLTLSELCDIDLLSEDGVVLKCHRCVLIARSEYFHSMLSCGWVETFSTKPLALPIVSKILEIVLDYLYTDNAPKVFASDDPVFLCHVLVVADRLLLDRLKAICEQALVEMITLRNVTELLELADLYNAVQLKTTCMQYICINLSSIIENGSLDILSDTLMEELTSYYRNLLPGMSKRIITPYSEGPSQEEMLLVAKQYPVNGEIDLGLSPVENTVVKSSEGKTRGRNRTHSCRSNSDDNKISKEKYNSENAKMNVEANICDINGSPELAERKISEKQKSFTKKDESQTPENTANKRQSLKTGWNTTEKKDTPLLKDIMKEEEVAQNVSKKSNDKPRYTQAGCAWNTKPMTDHIKPWNISSTTDSIKTSHCWNVKSTTEETPVPKFSDILKAEQQQESLIQQPKAKPLHLISLEDEAMEELLKLYDVNDNERVTVSRVLPEKTRVPVWRKHSVSSP